MYWYILVIRDLFSKWNIPKFTSALYILMKPEFTFSQCGTPLMFHSWFECSAKGPVLTYYQDYCPGSISNKYQFLRYFQYEYAMPPNFSSILPGWYILYILETCSLSQSVRKCQDLQKTLEVSFYDLQREKLMSHPEKTFMDFLLL